MNSQIRQTEIISIDPERPDPASIQKAAAIILQGGLVAFPTETVYGLGANALNSNAVEGIFRAKGRPAANPLIVHVADAQSALKVVNRWPKAAEDLAEEFWPGPLTLVLPRNADVISDLVTAGGPTVAVRSPDHPVARSLLRECGVPIAAPSANRSSRLSPTTAGHVYKGLNGRIDLILDAGPTRGGVESTVLDLSVERPTILRPGLIGRREIERIVGPVDVRVDAVTEAWKSPGMLKKHYSPRAKLLLADDDGMRLAHKLREQGFEIGWMPIDVRQEVSFDPLRCRPQSADPSEYASSLYATLHELDDLRVDYIVVQMPPDTEDWRAVRDRLSRAAHEAEH